MDFYWFFFFSRVLLLWSEFFSKWKSPVVVQSVGISVGHSATGRRSTTRRRAEKNEKRRGVVPHLPAARSVSNCGNNFFPCWSVDATFIAATHRECHPWSATLFPFFFRRQNGHPPKTGGKCARRCRTFPRRSTCSKNRFPFSLAQKMLTHGKEDRFSLVPSRHCRWVATERQSHGI